ncbi:hypothetical protein ABPG74_001507 [Tetrahymena malaccensis]
MEEGRSSFNRNINQQPQQNIQIQQNLDSLMDIENVSMIYSDEEVEVKINKTYVSNSQQIQRVVVRYVIEFKNQHFKTNKMVVNFDIKQKELQVKLVEFNDNEPKFQGVQFLDQLNLKDRFQKLMNDSQPLIQQQMCNLSQSYINHILSDGTQRYFELEFYEKLDKKDLNGSKPKISYDALFKNIFKRHPYFSESKKDSQQGNQFLYIMQTSLIPPNRLQNHIILKIGKTSQSIETYSKIKLPYQYKHKILFHPLVYFEIPCQDKCIVDKLIHNYLNENKSENKIYIQGEEHLHQEFFLLDRSFIQALQTILFSKKYTGEYKKEYSKISSKIMGQSTISQIPHNDDQNLSIDTYKSLVDGFDQISIYQSQMNNNIQSSMNRNVNYQNSQISIHSSNQQNGKSYNSGQQKQNQISDQTYAKFQNQPNQQIQPQRQKTFEVSQVQISGLQQNSLNNNVQKFDQQSKLNIYSNQQQQQKYQNNGEQNYDPDNKNIKEYSSHNYQTLPCPPPPPNDTHISIDQKQNDKELEKLLDQIKLEKQKLEDLRRELKETYQKISQI